MLSDEGLNDIVPPAIDLSIMSIYALTPCVIDHKLSARMER